MIRIFMIFVAWLGLTIAAFAQAENWDFEWPRTDFSKTSVDFNEITSGGPPKDGIPAVHNPRFNSVNQEGKLGSREPVMTVELTGQIPRAYPIRYLMWHEIVNDMIGNIPIAVTYCPLCNSGVTFDRRLKDGTTLTMGVTGKLRYSDMIMYDRETESWWQQFMGVGIVGEHTGVELKTVSSWVESWAEFKTRNPDGKVMRAPKYPRKYGQNPYTGYDTGRPFLYDGENPPHGIHPLARVVVVGTRAWPLERFKTTQEITESGVTITWKSGMASSLDSRKIAKGRDVGSIRVRNAQSGKDIAHDVAFAFAFHAFQPNGQWMRGR
jgi:hypothetical protein